MDYRTASAGSRLLATFLTLGLAMTVILLIVRALLPHPVPPVLLWAFRAGFFVFGSMASLAMAGLQGRNLRDDLYRGRLAIGWLVAAVGIFLLMFSQEIGALLGIPDSQMVLFRVASLVVGLQLPRIKPIRTWIFAPL